MAEYTIEKLERINSNPEEINRYKKDVAFNTMLLYAYQPNLKFLLPEGKPYTKPVAEGMNKIGLSDYNLTCEARRFYLFVENSVEARKRELIFTEIYEGLPPEEQEVFVAIKDQKLGELYPNITYELLKDYGLVSD